MDEQQTSHLLVVEDNKLNQMLLGNYLKNEGHRVSFAENGRMALELLLQRHFDMILLDIEMPEMNGYEVLAHVIANPLLQDIPVIVTSAVDQLDSVVRCIEMGAEDYLTKPIDRTLLKARIDSSLEKKRLRDRQKATVERLEREMELARITQMSILPSKLPKLQNYEFGAIMVPARSVGGDFYDVIPAGKNRWAIVIGDVAGKGLTAALYMTLTYSLLRAEALSKKPPAETLINVNRYLMEMNSSSMFVTVLCGILDCEKNLFTYARAGHLAPLLLAASGEIQKSPIKPSQAIGLSSQITLDTGQIYFTDNSTLLLFSDGVCEAVNEKNVQFDEQRLASVLLKYHQSTPQELCSKLWEEVQVHSGQFPQQDDFTVFAVKHTINQS